MHIPLIRTYERSHSMCGFRAVTGNDSLSAEDRNTCTQFQLGWGKGGSKPPASYT